MSPKPPPTKLSQITVNQDGDDCNASLLQKPPPTKLSQITVKIDGKDYSVCQVFCEVFCMCIIGLILIAGFLLFMNFIRIKTDYPIPEPPKPIEFIITDASITQFSLTSDNILYYYFTLNISVTNPEYTYFFPRETYFFPREILTISVISSYKGNKFAVVDMEPLTPKSEIENTILLKPVVFYGNSLIKLNIQQLMEYHNEARLGIFNLDLKLDFNNHEYAYCIGLGVPLISNEKLKSTFNVTKCSREYQGWG